MTENILPHLHYFWHAAKEENFTRAAKKLRISQSAVSLQIKSLEQKLQMQLFFRQSKNILALSPEGRQLYERCQTIFQDVEGAIGEILERDMAGVLVVSVATTFGATVLVPFVKFLENKYPKLRVDLDVSDTVRNFFSMNLDLGIRWGESKDPGLTYEVLTYDHIGLAASPAYLKNNPIRKIRDLNGHTLIVRRDSFSFEEWLKKTNTNTRAHQIKTRVITNTFASKEAVCRGMGIALFPMYGIEDSIKRKKLTLVLPQYKLIKPIYICYPKTKYPPPKIATFVTELRSYLKREYDETTFQSVSIE